MPTDCAFTSRVWHDPWLTRTIVVIDHSLLAGGPSVTNRAEEVVVTCLRRHGNHPIVYRDSDGQWDRLVHDGQRFQNFGFLSPAETRDARMIAALRESFP